MGFFLRSHSLRLFSLFAVVIALVASPNGSEACSTIGLFQGDQKVVAKSYDWDRDVGAIYVNKRNVAKQAISLERSTPVTWTSKWASYTFNQHGREFPISGMNEQGLVIEVMWLFQTEYPEPDHRHAINEIQWVQYQLDNFATVSEVLTHLEEIRIEGLYAPLHYMVCDALGSCATIEFVGMKTYVHSGTDLKTPVLTNDTYERSIAVLAKHLGFGGTLPIPTGLTSHARFVRMSHLVKEFDPKSHGDGVSYLLKGLSEHDYDGSWNLAYDLTNSQLSFRTGTQKALKSFSAKGFNPSCKDAVRTVSMDIVEEGDVTARFEEYSEAKNTAIVKAGLKDLPELPETFVQLIENYPATTRCME